MYRPWIMKSAQLAFAMALLSSMGCSRDPQKETPSNNLTTPEEDMSKESGDMPLEPADMAPGDMSVSPTEDMSMDPDLRETSDMGADAGMDSGVDMPADPDMGEVSGGATIVTPTSGGQRVEGSGWRMDVRLFAPQPQGRVGEEGDAYRLQLGPRLTSK